MQMLDEFGKKKQAQHLFQELKGHQQQQSQNMNQTGTGIARGVMETIQQQRKLESRSTTK